MREIKFRGIDTESGKWIYGGYVLLKSGVNCILSGEVSHMPLPDSRKQSSTYEELNVLQLHAVKYKTVGEFTGLKDKNGKEIYEGDIWIGKYYCGNNPQELKAICVMKWDDAHAQFYWEDIIFGMPDFIKPEVVGNIYENPELLKPVSKEAER